MSGRAAVVALVVAGLVATGGCGRVKRLWGGGGSRSSGSSGPVDPKRAALGESLSGLAAGGTGPVLSWDPVPGAVEYAVQVSDGARGRWSWLGAGTRVRYGAASAAEPLLTAVAKLEPRTVARPRAGARYRWFVTALDARGKLLSLSPMAEFTAQDGVSSPPPAPPQIRVPLTGPGAAPATTPEALLTEKKIRAFLVHKRETASFAADAMRVFTGAAGGPQVAGGAPPPDGSKLAARTEAALKKSGLTQEEVNALTPLLTAYYGKRSSLAPAQAGLAKSRASGRPGLFDEIHRGQVKEAEAARAAFGTKHGPAALAAVDACEAEYHQVNDLLMKSMTAPKAPSGDRPRRPRRAR